MNGAGAGAGTPTSSVFGTFMLRLQISLSLPVARSTTYSAIAILSVGNLAYDLSEQDVIDYFSSVGPVKSVRIVLDKETGKPRGFGFVEYHDVPTAESCVRNLGGTELNGRTMRIVFAESNNAVTGTGRSGGERTTTMFSNKAVGSDAVVHAAKGMGETLGEPFDPSGTTNRVVGILSRKNKNEMYTYLEQVQRYCTESPEHARQFFTSNPLLCQAILVIEILLGLVGNPLDAAGGGGGPVDPRKQRGDPRREPVLPGPPAPPPPPPTSNPPPPPRPMVSMRPSMPANMSEQQQALLAEVMKLTPEQIELLPPQQKAQVVALQQQMRTA
jgi:cleavage stimulation factor subunit 2